MPFFVLNLIAHMEMRPNLTTMVVVQVSSEAQFEYAWCLVRSKYPADIRKGIILLEDLFQVAFPSLDVTIN